MKLYLMRHAEAEAEASVADDSQRKLSEYGELQAAAMAKFLQGYGLQLGQVFHSGKLRAQQTAEFISQGLSLGDAPQVDSIFTGSDGLSPVVERINSWTENTLVVTHLPFISRLLSRLLISDADSRLVCFVPGTLISLEMVESAVWRLKWCINPELIMPRD
jgi:phosphohistidine phosphatase